MLRITPSLAMLGAIIILAGTVPAIAQNNTLLLLQETPVWSQSGNTLEIDQSEAENSRIAGFDPETLNNLLNNRNGEIELLSNDRNQLMNSTLPALQRGEGNRASITISDNGGTALLVQQGTGDGSFGADNTATITVSGAGALGVIEQSGNNNEGHVNITGTGATGILIQRGNNNSQDFQVTSSTPTTVVFQQIGNNMTPATGASVITNTGGTIQITQTRF